MSAPDRPASAIAVMNQPDVASSAAWASVARADRPAARTIQDVFRKLEFSHGHNTLILNALYRLPIGTRIRSYVGLGAGIAQLGHHLGHVPGGQELSFLDVDRLLGAADGLGGGQQVLGQPGGQERFGRTQRQGRSHGGPMIQNFFEANQQGRRLVQDLGAQRRQAKASALPLHQRPPATLFQGRDSLADRRLGDAIELGRFGKTLRLDEIGAGWAFSGLSPERINYFGLGGLSVYIGDGALTDALRCSLQGMHAAPQRAQNFRVAGLRLQHAQRSSDQQEQIFRFLPEVRD
mgnify:CR=1 FL=1